jgi:hypothetical protein
METQNQKVNIADLHFEHSIWQNEFAFFKQEIGIFEKRLGEVALKNTEQEAKAGIEHFQNQFIRHREVIDEMVHEIRLHEQELSHTAASPPVVENRRNTKDHDRMRSEMVRFRDIYGDLKEEYMRFLSQWM